MVPWAQRALWCISAHFVCLRRPLFHQSNKKQGVEGAGAFVEVLRAPLLSKTSAQNPDANSYLMINLNGGDLQIWFEG